MHKLLFVAGLALFAVDSRANAIISAQCQATPGGGICDFTNTGSDAGSGCANVVITHNGGGGSTAAAPACSGVLQAAEKKSVKLRFTGPDVTTLCTAPGAPAEFHCTMAVTMSDVTANGGGGGVPWFFWVLVLASSIGVFIDAKRIGARKGLVKGIADLGPGGWLVSCLLLWIIAFPLYLFHRGKIAAAARAAAAPPV